MKIAIFHELPPGGAKNAVYILYKKLSDLGHKVDLYYTSQQKDTHLLSKSIYFYQFGGKKWNGNDWRTRLYKDTIELAKLYKLHKKIAKDINSKKYDVVLVNGSEYIEAPFILRFLTIYSIFYCHDPNYRILYEPILVIQKLSFIKRIYENMNRFIRKIMDKSNFMSATEIYSNSKFSSEVIKRTYGRESKVVYLGVDTKFFKPQYLRKGIDVLFIGSRQPIDGYEILEGAIKKIKLKLKIKTVMSEDSWLSSKKIKDLYSRSKIVVSLAYNEPFGLVALEAMSCGVPVVAVNEGGYRETIVNDKTGFLIKRDINALASKIQSLIGEQIILKTMSVSARDYTVRNWDWKIRSRIFEEEIKKSILK